jgi:hypothetical protein
MNMRHLKTHSETYDILLKRYTTKRGYIQHSITDLRFSLWQAILERANLLGRGLKRTHILVSYL